LSPDALRLSSNGGWKMAVPSFLIWSSTTIESRLQAVTPPALLAETDRGHWGLSETMVGDAHAAEAANSSNKQTKICSLPLNTFFSALRTKAKCNEALNYKKVFLTQNDAVTSKPA
jgi:hypothetical protein